MMIGFLKANIGTIIVLGILILIIALIIRKMINDKKNGIGPCGCKCEECSSGCTNKNIIQDK